MTADARDGGEIEALVTDRYLESLLTLGLGDTARASLGETIAARLQPQVRLASDRLTRDAPRYHPSFRFEERVALNLAGIAASMRVQEAAGGEGTVVPIGLRPNPRDTIDPRADLLFDGPLDERPDRRPLLIGGALVTAAVAGVAPAGPAAAETYPDPVPLDADTFRLTPGADNDAVLRRLDDLLPVATVGDVLADTDRVGTAATPHATGLSTAFAWNAEDGATEVGAELQSAGPGEVWDVEMLRGDASLLSGERTTDEDGEIDVDAYASGNPGDATYEVTFTPADGEPCTATLGG